MTKCNWVSAALAGRPGLVPGPSSQPLHRQPQQAWPLGLARPCRPCLRTALHALSLGSCWTPGDHSDSETEPGQARTGQPGS